MTENKQYVTQIQDNGSVLISEDVIATIAAQAISEVEGIVGTNVRPGADLAEMIGKKNWGRGIHVNIGADDKITIDCDVIIAYGQSVINVSSAVQTAIAGAVESMTGVTDVTVNVNISGIERV